MRKKGEKGRVRTRCSTVHCEGPIGHNFASDWLRDKSKVSAESSKPDESDCAKHKFEERLHAPQTIHTGRNEMYDRLK